ncbi:hypothetical protein [Nocardioides soli]|uniref:Uncharacterized protein n=1 Tax=Nocardioides soli TaxID=1036020 RepID=A0A7W4VYD9_9ACTN|nr:hypothetical protein [Nocardioides soli]MBB3043980.1 hypothetical protein [Nocardioides soli]
MSTQTPSRPVGVDELKRAWQALNAGEFRTGPGAGKGPRGRGTAAEDDWTPADGEHTIAVIGSAGSVGASTVALATGLAAAAPVRVIECCSVTASGLAAASTAELGLHPTDWRQGKRDHVLLERASEVLAGVDEVPLPTEAQNETQLTILDIGWEAGQLLATDCWLAEAVRAADQIVLVTTATVPGMRRAGVAMDLLAGYWQPEQIVLAVRGPRRKKWPRGVEHAGGPAVRRALDADRCVEIPVDRELAVNGLDSRPVPVPLISAARQLLEPQHLSTDTSESA